STVQLDGAASTDADGDPLTFHWSFLSRPKASNAVLSDPSAVRPTFVVDVSGQYIVQLVVNDGFAGSPPDTVLIDTQNSPPIANAGTVDSRPDTVAMDTRNSRPVADAGSDQIVTLGQIVQLDGSHSSDIDHDPLTFRWSFVSRPAGSTAVISDVSAISPTFVP